MSVVLGTGYMPSNAQGTELQVVTRRAIVPKCVVQIYQHSPTVSAALANAQMTGGGVSSVMVPVQGSAMTTPQYTDASGAFNPPTNPNGISEAAYNLKYLVVPIGFPGVEGLIQYNSAVVPLLAARMNDSGNGAAQLLATDMATNETDGLQNINGLPLYSAASGTAGNISASGNSWWAGYVYDPGAGGSPSNNTYATWVNFIIAATKRNGGESPNIGVCAPGTWAQLAASINALQQLKITPSDSFDRVAAGPRIGFTALMINGVPIYMDNNFTEGYGFLWNTKYTGFYIHELAAFGFTGFASTLPAYTLGFVGVMVAALEFCTVKRRSVFQIGSSGTHLLDYVSGIASVTGT